MPSKFTTKDGSRSKAVIAQVVRNRDGKNPSSWAALADKLGVSPRTVRRLYDEGKGQDAHFANRPLVGGRNRQAQDEESEA